MDVAVWLRSLGLGQYEAAFRENEVSERILPNLTQEDLKEIGVGPVGHRRTLLEAIAALRSDTGSTASSAAAATPSSAPGVSPEDRAERRQVTVLFSDLVGSTALSTRMDPEDLRDVISAYRKVVAETVDRFGGFVAKYMGDGVLVYFGYPQAHEDDAERAVRAGLELLAAVVALDCAVTLQTRVGIATGLVVIGDLIGSGEAQERSIVGETPNLAARLQGVARPDMVVISETTRRLVGNLFELEELGALDLKGLSSPVRAWSPLRSRPVTSRFEALRIGTLMPLVGRGNELDLLLRRWERARSGEGQVLLISGEAGIGKSRLNAALVERLAGEPLGMLSYSCSPQHLDSAYYPVVGLVERAAEFGHGDSPQQRLDKLDSYLHDNGVSEQDAALFADMLFLHHDGCYPVQHLTPEQQRERTLQVLVGQVERLAQRSPLLIVFEDVHWCDPTTLEFLNRMVATIAPLRAFAIVTCRPDFSSPWADQSHVAYLKLDRLDDREATMIASQLVGERTLPMNVLAAIAARADGNPLFVEEITKAVVEAESEGNSRNLPVDTAQAPSVPTSLQASLMARLDRLGTETKEIAQTGAAIGREFPHFLLAAVASRSDARLRQSLNRLIEAGLVFRQGGPSQASYVFKHALVRDAAYSTLLRGDRRSLHLRIARALEAQRQDVIQASPESLAHHYTEANAIERAAVLWGVAGRRSRTRSALAEAEAQLSRALGQIATLPPTSSLRREQIALQLELVTVLMHTKGYGAEQTKVAAEHARALIEQAEAIGEPPEDPLLLFSVIYGFWVVNIAAFNGDAARELANQFIQLAARQSASGPLLLGHRMMGMTLMSVGNPMDGREHLDRAFALYDVREHRALATHFGTDAQVAIMEWRSRTRWLLGFPLAARSDAEQSFMCAREIDQAATLMHALAHSTATLILLGDVAEANARATELIALAEDKRSSYWHANGRMWQGCLMAQTGRSSEAISTLISALDDYHSTGATIYTPFVMSYLARAQAGLGRHDEARDVMDRAIAMAQSTREQWCEAELFRIKGELALVSKDADVTAEAHFEQALGIARQQKAKSWELRVATSVARLWRNQDRSDAARNLLAPVYDWFTEGLDTVDLKEAKRLLDAS